MTKKKQQGQQDVVVRRKAMGVQEFATGKKGATRALQEYKRRKRVRVTEKAALLRNYKKAMRQEGYEPARGASRKRPVQDDEEKEEPDVMIRAKEDISQHPERNNSTNGSDTMPPAKRKRPKKSDPFADSLQKSQKRRQYRQQQEQERHERQVELEAKLKKRQQRAKLMAKRTKRGQPVMKHVINNLLDKLQQSK